MPKKGASPKQGKLVLKPWTIYLWSDASTVYAAAPVVTRDGLKEIYRCAWSTESLEGKNVEKTEKKRKWTAKSYCKRQLRGTMNILNWFGRKALDPRGNIDKTKLTDLFALQAYQAEKAGKYPEDLWPEIKFPTKEISYQEAQDYHLA